MSEELKVLARIIRTLDKLTPGERSRMVEYIQGWSVSKDNAESKSRLERICTGKESLETASN
jgi:hypothetical protein